MKFESGQKVLCILVGKDDQFLQISKCKVMSCLIEGDDSGNSPYEAHGEAGTIFRQFEGNLYTPKEAKTFINKFVKGYEKN